MKKVRGESSNICLCSAITSMHRFRSAMTTKVHLDPAQSPVMPPLPAPGPLVARL
jgi:hypothetical protein